MAISTQSIIVLKETTGKEYSDLVNVDWDTVPEMVVLFDDIYEDHVYWVARATLDDTAPDTKNGMKEIAETLKPAGDSTTSNNKWAVVGRKEGADALFQGNISLMNDFIKSRRDLYGSL